MTNPVDPREVLPPPPPPPSAVPRHSASPNTAPAPGGLAGGEWPDQAADAVVNLVDQVRAKTTGPILSVSRALVYGLIVGVLAIVVGVLAIIFSVRLLDELLPWGVWLPYLILGVLFTTAGALVFQRRG